MRASIAILAVLLAPTAAAMKAEWASIASQAYGKMEHYSDEIFVKDTVGIYPSKREECKFLIPAVLGQRS